MYKSFDSFINFVDLLFQVSRHCNSKNNLKRWIWFGIGEIIVSVCYVWIYRSGICSKRSKDLDSIFSNLLIIDFFKRTTGEISSPHITDEDLSNCNQLRSLKWILNQYVNIGLGGRLIGA